MNQLRHSVQLGLALGALAWGREASAAEGFATQVIDADVLSAIEADVIPSEVSWWLEGSVLLASGPLLHVGSNVPYVVSGIAQAVMGPSDIDPLLQPYLLTLPEAREPQRVAIAIDVLIRELTLGAGEESPTPSGGREYPTELAQEVHSAPSNDQPSAEHDIRVEYVILPSRI
ncbi:MAG: hypothetical protein HY698_08430 [Deltaproteobacteria bacterium]|nr:hypothetical protein [Deltaproteobacteria bacterium]